MTHSTLLAAAVTLLAACASGSPTAAQARLALVDVTVIDGRATPARPHQTILIEGGRIAAIFPVGTRALPPGTVQPAVSGSFVMPGLIDSHVHLATFDRPENIPRAILRFALLGGVTTVRDMGGNAERVLAFARAAEPDTALSPRVYASAVFAGPSWFAAYDSTRIRFWSGAAPRGAAPGVRRIDDSTDIPAAVRTAKALGVRGIKLYAGLRPEQIDAIGRAARAQGLAVWSHAVSEPSRPQEVVAARPTTISHSDQLIWASMPAGAADIGSRERRSRLFGHVAPDAPELQPLFAQMVRERVLLEPTLLVMQLGDVKDGRIGPLGAVQGWAVGAARAAHRAGVGIVAGTDAIGQQVPNIHTELQLLVQQVGLSPLQAIQAATEHGARALGIEDSTGTIVVGKWADLVVLRADPAVDIRNTQTVRAVLRRGVLHERPAAWPQAPGAEPPPAAPER